MSNAHFFMALLSAIALVMFWHDWRHWRNVIVAYAAIAYCRIKRRLIQIEIEREERITAMAAHCHLELCEFNDECDHCDHPKGRNWASMSRGEYEEVNFYVCEGCLPRHYQKTKAEDRAFIKWLEREHAAEAKSDRTI